MCQANQQAAFDFAGQKFPAGVHICHLYTSEDECRNTIAQFIQSGLLAGEKIGYLADAMDDMNTYLSELGVTPPDQVTQQQLVLAQAEPTYCPDGTFIPERMLDYLRSFYNQALNESFAGTRMAGEINWLSKAIPGIERWLQYEALINSLVEEIPINGIMCQYDVSKLDGAMLFDVLNVHPMMIVAGQVVHNPYFSIPDKPAPSYKITAPVKPIFFRIRLLITNGYSV